MIQLSGKRRIPGPILITAMTLALFTFSLVASSTAILAADAAGNVPVANAQTTDDANQPNDAAAEPSGTGEPTQEPATEQPEPTGTVWNTPTPSNGSGRKAAWSHRERTCST